MRTFCMILGLAALYLPLSAEQVHLRDGRVIEGEVSYHEDEGRIDVRVESGGIRATFHFTESEVERVEVARSPEARRVDAIWAEFEQLPEPVDPEKVWALAERLRELDETLEVRAMAEEVIALDADHVAAREALGFEKYEGEWMKPHEVARAKGLVRYASRWVTPEERDRIQAREAEERRLRHEERMERMRLAAARRRERSTSATVLGVTYTSPYYGHSGYHYGGWGGYCDDDDNDGIVITRDGRVLRSGTVVTRDGRILGNEDRSTTVIHRYVPAPRLRPVYVPYRTSGLTTGFRYRDDHWTIGGSLNLD